jgi:hypothetical protein
MMEQRLEQQVARAAAVVWLCWRCHETAKYERTDAVSTKHCLESVCCCW